MRIVASSGDNNKARAMVNGTHDREVLLLVVLIILYNSEGINPEVPLADSPYQLDNIRYCLRNGRAFQPTQ